MSDSKVFLVTGAASGIGLALARELSERGHRVLATDVNQDGLRQAHGDGVETMSLDVRDAARWDECIAHAKDRFGRLDVLCNVAGHLVAKWVHEMTPADVGLTIDVNVKGVMFGTNAAARVMIEQGGGHIINVASIAGLVPVPGLAAYSASKHAVRAWSLAAAQELKAHGVYVTAVCPGPVDTPMLDAQVDHDEAALTFSAPRMLTAQEVVDAIMDRALVLRPMEVLVTVPRSGQAPMARLVGALPELGTWVRPIITRIGRHNQARARAKRR
ncbi:MAG: SDR family oxidoreductase [Myxococcales bacterium]|nr:SDR family oxidoreductase [Myxococcales bacterium]MCB9580395.1 SDR family oxidoreductase [Polyangiaceae bacterium]